MTVCNLCLLLIVPVVSACGPGAGTGRSADSGKTSDKPEMKFVYSPPLGWTFAGTGKTIGGQAMSETSAKRRINADIEFAVRMAVESYGFSNAGVKVHNAVEPKDIQIFIARPAPDDNGNDNANDNDNGNENMRDDDIQQLVVLAADPAKTCKEDEYLEEDGVVDKQCTDDDATKSIPFNITGSVSITSPVAMAKSNWENIATKVWAFLSSNAGVKIHGLIDVVV